MTHGFFYWHATQVFCRRSAGPKAWSLESCSWQKASAAPKCLLWWDREEAKMTTRMMMIVSSTASEGFMV